MIKKRGDWKAYECLCYHVGVGGNFSTGQNLPALKFFLSTDQPWSRKQHTTHPRQTARGLQSISQSTLAKRPKGYTTIHTSPSPQGQRATKFQTSKSTLEYRNLTCACWSLPGSRCPGCPPQTQIFSTRGFLHKHGACWPPSACIKLPPHPFGTRGGSPTTLTLA